MYTSLSPRIRSMSSATWAVFVILLTSAAMPAQNPEASAGSSSSPVIRTAVAVEAYWTPQRLLSAKPIDLHPVARANSLPVATSAPAVGTEGVKVNGAPPTVELGARAEKVLIPEQYLEPNALAIARGTQPESVVAPTATSSQGSYFTTSRVFPDSATTAYPNRAAGKLFFSDPRTGGNFICSASVLRQRVVVTAGHCVASPSLNAANRYFYTNFLFVPAYRNGVAPYGNWTPKNIFVANVWFTSDGSVPNAQDVGMLVMNDNGGQRIGDVTGYLGYSTLQLAKNHMTMIGYPGNLDSGERMEINQAFTFGPGGNNTYIYGSAMRGGSSGGPWIVDYGVLPVANPAIPLLGRNLLVSVTSYGPTATEPKYQGASNLDSRFTDMLNLACGTAAGNCN